MARPNFETVLSSINNAGAKTAEALKHIIAEKKKNTENVNGANSNARERILSILDEGTFSEIGTYTFRKNNEYDPEEGLEGVICGWGSLDGRLVYCFSQDYSRAKGAMSEAHAKKIKEIYRLAVENGAPIIGIFDSAGAVIPEGVKALAAYATIMSCASNASGVIPQIAMIPGVCAGSSSIIASMFDFVIITDDTGSLCMNSPFVINCLDAGKSKFALETGLASLVAKNAIEACSMIRELVSFLPSNNIEGTVFDKTNENANRLINDTCFSETGDIRSLINGIADNSKFFELYPSYGSSFNIGFISISGSVCGVVASNYANDEGRLTISAARKSARFISFCDSFNIPVLSILNTAGVDVSENAERSTYAAELAKLASVYASARTPLVTLIVGQAYGAAYTILGSKSLGADIVYAFENAKIGAMSASSAVAFLWNDNIDKETSRDDLEKIWDKTCGSPAAAAASGEIDDIISISETRIRIAATFEMLSMKSKIGIRKRHTNMPL